MEPVYYGLDEIRHLFLYGLKEFDFRDTPFHVLKYQLEKMGYKLSGYIDVNPFKEDTIPFDTNGADIDFWSHIFMEIGHSGYYIEGNFKDGILKVLKIADEDILKEINISE